MATTTKNLVYKLARFNKPQNGRNLQELLIKALQKRKTAMSRRQQGGNEREFKLINYHGSHKTLRVGEFFDYIHGHKQPTAKFDDALEALEIDTIAPPDKQSDFLNSILYYGIWKNSVILSQSQSLRSNQFEDYLNWLLRDTRVLEEEDYVSLSDHPPINAESEIFNAKGIEFHAPVSLEPVEKTGPSAQAKSVQFKPGNIGWEAFKSILPSELTLPRELSGKDIVPNGELEVTLMLSWKRLGKSDPTSLLDSISNQLRHVDTELDYTIHTRSGQITRDQIKLRKPASVGVTDSGLVRKDDMWNRMSDWLEALLNEERIAPNA